MGGDAGVDLDLQVRVMREVQQACGEPLTVAQAEAVVDVMTKDRKQVAFWVQAQAARVERITKELGL